MTYAQWNDDDWIVSVFPAGYQGYAVDVGAFDGVTISNTKLLEQKGWEVLCVEPNPGAAAACRQHRKHVVECACASREADDVPFSLFVNNTCAYSSLERHPGVIEAQPGLLWKDITVRVRTLDSLLADWKPPRLDLLSVDTEGTELDVLKGFHVEQWYPKVIIAELWDESHGVKDDPITPYLAQFGYRLEARVGENNRYLR